MMWETKRVKLLEWVKTAAKSVFFGLLAIFLLNFLVNFTAFATESGFSWENNTIKYNNQSYSKQAVQGETGKTFYVAREGDKAHVLIFNGEATKAKQATHVVYDVGADNRFSNPRNQTTVNLTTNSNSANIPNNSATAENLEISSSCTIEGIGWILCPVMKSISQGMDNLQEVIAKFMTIKPISTDRDSILVKAWQVMRNIANIVFIIVFLIIIMSYVTNYGVDNYSVKKMLPKLVVGSILVNISFYVCVLAVDLANIVGGSIVNLFRELQIQIGGGQAIHVSWLEFTKAALAGGSLAIAGGYTAAFALGGLPGIIFALLSALVSALITLFVTVVILAGRQAMIITLIIVSPLAFVASLMPNTETYFNKWKDTMKKLLILLPVFSVIYGSAQLAGWIILSSAQDVIVVLLGMIVQVIPFLMLPKMVKESDSLLGKLSDGLDKTFFNPIRSRTNDYFDRKIDEQRAAYSAREARGLDIANRLTKAFDKSKRMTEERTAAYKKKTEANYINAKNNAKYDHVFNRYKSTRILEEQADRELENAKLDLKITNKNLVAEMFESIKKEKDINKGLAKHSKLERELAKASLMNRVKQSEELMATGAQAMNYNQMLQDRLQLENYRGKTQDIILASTGFFKGKEGSEVSVISKMLAATKKEYQEELSNYRTAMGVYKLSTDQLEALVMGNEKTGFKPGKVEARDDQGNVYVFDGSESAVWEAAAHKLFPFRIDLLTSYLQNTDKIKVKNEEGKIDEYDLTWRIKHSTQVANLVREHGLGKAATYLGNVSPELIEQGKIGKENMAAIMLNQLVKGRFSSNEFINQDKDATEAITKLVKNLASNISFNGPDGKFGDEKSDTAIGFGIDNLTMPKIIEGFEKYQKVIHDALNPKGETFRQLKEAQIKNMRELDKALSEYTKIKPTE